MSPKLPKYSDDPQKYYAVLKSLSPDELRQEWREIDVKEFDWLLCCVPPVRINSSSFMVGEPATHGSRGPIHDVCVCITEGKHKRYFIRPAYLVDWKRDNYAAEIRELFYPKVKEQSCIYYQEFDEFSDTDPGL